MRIIDSLLEQIERLVDVVQPERKGANRSGASAMVFRFQQFAEQLLGQVANGLVNP